MNLIFIAGTNTDSGKTIATGVIASILKDKGCNVCTQKWISTGYKKNSNDIITHLKIMNSKKIENENLTMPYCFKFPASPHLSSKLENKKISTNKIKNSVKKLSSKFDFVIIEGTGGLFTPINDKKVFIDLISELKIPIILTIENKLGAINNALLNIEAIKKRKIKLLGLIFNNISNENKKILDDNIKIITKFSKSKVLGIFTKTKNISILKKCISNSINFILNNSSYATFQK
jgi:dethiobiotin synthetase